MQHNRFYPSKSDNLYCVLMQLYALRQFIRRLNARQLDFFSLECIRGCDSINIYQTTQSLAATERCCTVKQRNDCAKNKQQQRTTEIKHGHTKKRDKSLTFAEKSTMNFTKACRTHFNMALAHREMHAHRETRNAVVGKTVVDTNSFES